MYTSQNWFSDCSRSLTPRSGPRHKGPTRHSFFLGRRCHCYGGETLVLHVELIAQIRAVLTLRQSDAPPRVRARTAAFGQTLGLIPQTLWVQSDNGLEAS